MSATWTTAISSTSASIGPLCERSCAILDPRLSGRLYQTDIASKQTKDLTPFEKVRVDIVAYEWSSPDTILVQMNQRDAKLFDVHRIDLNTGKVELDTENPGDVQSWLADNALRIRAAQAQSIKSSSGGKSSNWVHWISIVR